MKKLLLIMFMVIVATIQMKAQNGSTTVDNAVQGSVGNQFNYGGSGWVHATNTTDPYHNSTVSYSNHTGDFCIVNFNGNQITLYSAKAPHHGIIAVSVDDGPETFVDLYASVRQSFFSAYTSQTLAEGNHVLKIRVTGTKNLMSSNTYAIIDYMIISANTNFSLGGLALQSVTTGGANLAIGKDALQANTIGYQNIGIGYKSLYSNTGSTVPFTGTVKRGSLNTAIGTQALYLNKDGNSNIAIGPSAMQNNSSGYENTALGREALFHNDAGYSNTAIGTFSMYNNYSGSRNTAVGAGALGGGSGSDNCAIGYLSISSLTTGFFNVGIGNRALESNTNGIGNVGIGNSTLYNNKDGNYNTAIGNSAGYYSETITNSTMIGNGAFATTSNQVRLGNNEVTSIGGVVSWSTLSDGRVKKDLKEDVSGLEFIEKLRPVSYTVDKIELNRLLRIPESSQPNAALRGKPVRQIGFVAQEVEAVVKKTGYIFSGIEVPQNENDHYSIRYAEFVVPLVKAVQELSATIKDQKDEIEQLKLQLQANDNVFDTKHSKNVAAVLFQNSPNPFSTDTEIKVTLPGDARNAVLMIYNLEGKQLKNVPIQERGHVKVKMLGNELRAGMYLYTLIVDGEVIDTKRMILTQ